MQHTISFNKGLLSDGERKEALTQLHTTSQCMHICCHIVLLSLPTHDARWGLFCSAFIFKRKRSANSFPWCFNYDSAVCKTLGLVFCAFNSCVSLSMEKEKMFEGMIAPGTFTDMQCSVFPICLNGSMRSGLVVFIPISRK